MPLLRVPYTDPLPLPKIIPPSASTTNGAVAALVDFLAPSLPGPPRSSSRINASLRSSLPPQNGATLLLTGAGISVASGLADYRGTNGTYTMNKTYRPIYFHEFCENHEARKRYWARSFLGWTNLHKAKPNRAHAACGELGRMGVVHDVITQNVDSFHPISHPSLPSIELHGYLRSLVCLTCRNEYSRRAFQTQLAMLNPLWAEYLQELLESGALDTENPEERRKRGFKTNPDGDADIPGAPYTTFRYPACPTCLEKPPQRPTGGTVKVHIDEDGAWDPRSEGGVLKPAVIMFGESIPAVTKVAAEEAIDAAGRILVIGSSLATYSAWRLVKRAKDRDMPIGILNMGGVRGEDTFFGNVPEANTGRQAVRCSDHAEEILPRAVKILAEMKNTR